MPFFTSEQLIARARSEIKKGGVTANASQRSQQILTESKKDQDSLAGQKKHYDIFLSHSTNDAEQVLGLKLIIEDLGHSVYIDWIDDPHLDRKSVSKNTANALRERMKQSDCLLYAFSKNSNESKWMPWELGYFDALKGKVAVLPITQNNDNTFKGTEYLGLYYYIKVDLIRGTKKNALWVYDGDINYVIFDNWKNLNAKPFKHE